MVIIVQRTREHIQCICAFIIFNASIHLMIKSQKYFKYLPTICRENIFEKLNGYRWIPKA